MTRPTVLVDARLPWGSGIGRYVRNIVPPVASLISEVNFTLLVSPSDAEPATAVMAGSANIAVETTTISPFSLSEQTRLSTLAAGYDLTWFTNYWVPLRWKRRFVVTVHDLIHLDQRFPASAAKRFAAARTFAKIRRDAAHIVFVSRFSARMFVAKVGTPRAASVVHHGIDHAGTGSAMSETERERCRTALVVAAAKEHKNLSLLLDAWARAKLADWRLIVVTPGDDLRSSIDLAAQVAKGANVEIVSKISDAELHDLYAGVGFALVPSRYEGFGLPLLEAMRAGTPVVSSTADALVEVASGAAIPFVDPDDRIGWVEAIRSMAAECGPSSDWQRAVGARNRRIANTFTWDKAAVRTAAIIRDVLSETAGQ